VPGKYLQLSKEDDFVTSVPSMHDFPRSSIGEEGFTLLEGMIAAVILAVGLLSLAGMQGISLGRNVDANELTLATNLAADMVERIQFNRRNASVYASIDTLDSATRPAANVMARGDYGQWQARLVTTKLSNVQGRVAVRPIGPTVPPLNQNEVIVTVNWRTSSGTSRNKSVALATVIAPE
jgi:type IV pilus assembly protein PilV